MALEPITFKRNTTAVTDRQRSPAIWADCPWSSIAEGEIPGKVFFDDFTEWPLNGVQTTQINHSKYKVFNSGTPKVLPISAVNSVEIAGGVLSMPIDGDDEAASVAQSYPTFLLSGLTSNSGKLWFECCYAQKSVVTNMAAVMIGLAETDLWTLAAGVPFNAGDPITNSASFVGFRIEEDGLGVIDTVYSDRATSFTNIGDTEGGTLTAYTFKKLGMVYDPTKTGTLATRPLDCAVSFYVDNQVLTTGLTSATLIALTNLDANALGLIWASCADSAGTAFEGYMKWWRVAQLFPN